MSGGARLRSRSAPPRGGVASASERRIAELEEELKQLHATANQQARLREDVEDEVAEQRDDIAGQVCDQAELETEVLRLRQERDELRATVARMKADLNLAERKFSEAQRQVADKDQLAKRPAMVLAQKERKNKLLQEQLDEKASIIKLTKEQLAQARAALQKASSGMVPEETRDHLLQQLLSSQKEQSFCEAKCWQLEEQLEERERALEEAKAETQRLVGCRDEQVSEELQTELAAAKAREEQALEKQSGELERCQAQACRLGAQLRTATQVLAEFESTTAHLRDQLAAKQEAEEEARQRSRALARRCNELEVAGKKLLDELDARDRQLEDQVKHHKQAERSREGSRSPQSSRRSTSQRSRQRPPPQWRWDDEGAVIPLLRDRGVEWHDRAQQPSAKAWDWNIRGRDEPWQSSNAWQESQNSAERWTMRKWDEGQGYAWHSDRYGASWTGYSTQA